ncbi:MAG: hypothetical protein ACKVQA_15615 [Burkholderiales bacterium]
MGKRSRPWRLLASLAAFSCFTLALLGSPVVSGAETANSARPARAEVMKRKAHKPLASAKTSKNIASSKAAPAAKVPAVKTPAAQKAKKPVRPSRPPPVRAQTSASAEVPEPAAQANIAAPVREGRSASLLWPALATVFILGGVEVLWRRRRHAGTQWQPVEFIEPVFNIDVSDLTSLQYPAAPASLPPRKSHARWHIARESDADAWRVAAVEPAF